MLGAVLVLAGVLAVGGLLYLVTRGDDSLPAPDSPRYAETLAAFNVGVAAILVDQYDHATAQLTRAAELVPEEPASWANLGLIQVRVGEFDEADTNLALASSLAPRSSQIWVLRGLLESRRGRYDVAISHLEQALELDTDHARARYALAKEIERQGGEGADLLAERQLDALLERRGDNLAVLLDKCRLAAKRGDVSTLRGVLLRIAPHAAAWPPEVRERFEALTEAAAGPDAESTSTQIVFLRNVLVRVPSFRESLAEVMVSPDIVGEPLERFLVLPLTDSVPAPADMSLSYRREPLAAAAVGSWSAISAASLEPEGEPGLFVASGVAVRRLGGTGAELSFPGGALQTPATAAGVRPLDWNYDFRTDLALAGAGGVRLLQQQEDGGFTDVTEAAGLPAGIVEADYAGVWTVDVELDGDLDLVLGARAGATRVIRNNGDGTFVPIETFSAVSELRDLVWVELDQDGDPDVALLDAEGHVHFQRNDRAGDYAVWPSPAIESSVVAITAADADADGVMDIVGLRSDGVVVSVTGAGVLDGRERAVVEVTRWAEIPTALAPGQARLFVGDLDNNGATDLVASAAAATQIWLRDSGRGLTPLPGSIDAAVYAVTDLTGDGLVDLVGLSSAGQPVRDVGLGDAAYHWQVIRPRATRGDGDQRINSFALGGVVQLRGRVACPEPAGFHAAGALRTRRAHRYRRCADRLAERRLPGGVRPGGRCGPRHGTTAEGILPLALQLRRDRDAVRDGFSLAVAARSPYQRAGHGGDHPDRGLGQDPRRPARGQGRALRPPHHRRALGDVLRGPREPAGRRSPRRHRRLRRRTLRCQAADAARGAHDGAAATRGARLGRPGDRGHRPGPCARRPTSRDVRPRRLSGGHTRSLRGDRARGRRARGRAAVAPGPRLGLSHRQLDQRGHRQGQRPPPRGIAVEVPDGGGGWVVVYPDIGFPAGKRKTILIDVTDVFRPGAPRRVRLRTNLEVYWDSLEYAAGLDGLALETRRLGLETAELRHRGFSRTSVANAFSPEVPDYDAVVGTGQRWLDLVGYYTRFGEVGELLAQVDDRYVIMNAGEEIALGFSAPAPPPEGWRRDYVLIGDGWIKDGDFNTGFSTTVLPLPSHDDPGYATPPGRIEDDPVYRRHPADWQRYHTRYVTPDRFRDPLRGGTQGSR